MLSDDTRVQLETLRDNPDSAQSLRNRCAAILLAALNLTTREIAEQVGTSTSQVSVWRRRFKDGGLEGLIRRPARGQPRSPRRAPPPDDGAEPPEPNDRAQQESPLADVTLSDAQRQELHQWIRSPLIKNYLAQRARVILQADAGYTAAEINDRIMAEPEQILHWCARFNQDGMDGLRAPLRAAAPPPARIVEADPDKVRVGVLSHAHGHLGIYCQVMQDYEDASLVAGWDPDEERGRAAAQQYGYEFRPSAQAVVDDPAIDAVMIGIETNRHADMVELAARAGKHVLLQKPMATTLADCDRIVRAVNETGIKFSMAFQMRHDPANIAIKRLLEQGVVGKVSVVRRRHCIGVLLNEDFVNSPARWHFDPEANVGMFFDDASHPADWFYWLLGRPTSVIAEIDRIVTPLDTDDTGMAVYRFGQGEMGVLFNASTTVAGVNTTEIYGDEGTIIQDFGDGPSVSAPRPPDAAALRYIRRGDAEWTVVDVEIPAAHAARIGGVPRPFIDYVRGLTDATVSAEDGKVSVEMVLGAYRAAQQGCRVALPLTV